MLVWHYHLSVLPGDKCVIVLGVATRVRSPTFFFLGTADFKLARVTPLLRGMKEKRHSQGKVGLFWRLLYYRYNSTVVYCVLEHAILMQRMSEVSAGRAVPA